LRDFNVFVDVIIPVTLVVDNILRVWGKPLALKKDGCGIITFRAKDNNATFLCLSATEDLLRVESCLESKICAYHFLSLSLDKAESPFEVGHLG